MATQILTNATVNINSQEIAAARCIQVKVTDAADLKEDTAMGATYKTYKGGGALKMGKIEVTLLMDRGTTASTGTDILLAPLVGSTSSYNVVVLANGTTVGASNPKWTLTNAQLQGDYQAVGGKVGDLEQVSATFVPGSGGTLTRSTT